MIISYLLGTFLLLYLVQLVVVILAIRRPRDEIDLSARPFITVVIAARDEEVHLPACLESALNQTYDRQSFEVMVVNDHSSDRTEAICQAFAARFAHFTYLNAREDAQLRGKTNALDQGIGAARGEIILITDADCTVPPTWVEWTAKRYVSSVGIVGGLTLQKSETWFEGMQSLDWAYLLGLAGATMSLRIPLSTIGNNLSFRKSAYEDVGGYRKIPFSVTEDFMLFKAIVQSKKWDYVCPVDPRVLVISQPCSGWRELIRQKHRWGTGGLDMNFRGLSIGVIGFGLNSLLLIALALGYYVAAACSLLVKMFFELSFLYTLLRTLRHLQYLRFFLWFEVYFICYVLVLPFLVFFGGSVVWKGRSY
jgi:1,2-diacylglycerol 3-beta-glucosyltransferase